MRKTHFVTSMVRKAHVKREVELQMFRRGGRDDEKCFFAASSFRRGSRHTEVELQMLRWGIRTNFQEDEDALVGGAGTVAATYDMSM